MTGLGSLENRTVLVTGGARRLGRALAIAAAERGAHVAFTFLRSEEAARETLAHINSVGQPGFAIHCDVRSEASVMGAVSSVLEHFGGLDVLINSAGLFETVALEDLTLAQWDNLFSINVRGPFLVSRQCLPALRKSRGRIIHLGSLGGFRPWVTHAHYCCSKAALNMLTAVMAKALAPEIAVNCVAPGMIDAGDGRDQTLLNRTASRAPTRRNGAMTDVTNAVMYFATAPTFITGQILTVDGGLGLS